jgi:hypothetical protein
MKTVTHTHTHTHTRTHTHTHTHTHKNARTHAGQYYMLSIMRGMNVSKAPKKHALAIADHVFEV